MVSVKNNSTISQDWVVINGFQLLYFGVGTDTDVVLGIEPVVEEHSTGNDGQMYNLSGLRVDDSYRGIVIQNGKKILKK